MLLCCLKRHIINLMENVYVMGNKANYDWIMESKTQLEKGNFAVHDLTEVSADE